MEVDKQGDPLGLKVRRWCTDPTVISLGIWVIVTLAAITLAIFGFVNSVTTIVITNISAIVLFVAGQTFRQKKHSKEITDLKSEIASNNQAHKKELQSRERRNAKAITAAAEESRAHATDELETSRRPHIRHALIRHLELESAVGQAVAHLPSMAAASREWSGNTEVSGELRTLLMDFARELAVMESVLASRLDVSELNLGEWRRIDHEAVEEAVQEFKTRNERGHNA